jgi:copper chaperone
MKELTFDVPGVSCNHCIHSITEATKEVGVQDVQVDLVTKKVYVAFDPSQVQEAAVKEAIEEAGYDITGETVGKAIGGTLEGKKSLNVM